MRRLDFDRRWRFHLGEILDGISHAELDDSRWRPVDLPHDWSIELERSPPSPSGSAGGYFPSNGNPTSTEPYTGERRSAYRGRCLVVLKSSGAGGEIRLHAEATGLAGARTAVVVA
jgi:hypothetical protein